MSKHLVFVYGSLRRGNPGAMSVRFPDAAYVGGGEVRGRLYDLGAYPALLLDESGGLVTGEVYEVTNETLNKLDQFELTSDYERREVEVEQGTELKQCWIYVPSHDASYFANRSLIESGDWNKHLRARHAGSTNQPPTLVAAVFVICVVAILILNIIKYFQDGRIGTFSIFGFMIILLGLWFYLQGKKANREHKE